MIWVTWYQHRREAEVAGIVAVLVAAFLLMTGSLANAAAAQLGLSSCHLTATDPANCGIAFTEFMQRFLPIATFQRMALVLLPALLGLFVGAPLLAREVEHGTHVLAWTQSITRFRWFMVKVALLAGVTLVAAAGMSTLVTWWHHPFDVMFGSGRWTFFDTSGLVPVAYALFALALGIAAGMLIQRSVPAMAATLVLLAVTRFWVSVWRPKFQSPVIREADFGANPPFPMEALQVGLYWVDQHHNQVPYDRINQVIQQLAPGSSRSLSGATALSANDAAAISQYLRDQGFHYMAAFQPVERFWAFQALEAGIFLTLALLLFGLSLWWLRHRVR